MKEISVRSGEVHMNLDSGRFYVTADAMDTLKQIGEAYKIFSSSDERRGYRIALLEQPQRMLVAQEYTVGSEWEPIRVITKDDAQIRACLAFQELLSALQDMERDANREASTPIAMKGGKRKGVRHER